MTDWDDLRFFLAIWRAGNLTAAAKVLQVNQTTVGRRLGALEERLGVLLFDRRPEGLRVTAAGQKIIPVATEMEEAAQSLARLVAGSDEKLEGTVRLACSDTLAIGFVMEGLAAFRGSFPRIAVAVVTGNPPINLLRREADVAIRTPRPTQSELVVRKLVDAQWYLYAAQSSARPLREGEADGSLDAYEAVVFEGDLASLGPAQWINQHLSPERVALRCNSILTACTAIRAGAGVGALPAFIGDREPGLVRVLPDPISTSSLWLAIHPDVQGQARVRALIDFLVDLFVKNRARFGASVG